MEQFAKLDEPRGVAYVFVYTREAHPGEKIPHHRTFDEKVSRAEQMAVQLSRRMLVDDLQGTAHTAYGALPNLTVIVARGGRIAFRSSWTDPATIHPAVERILADEQLRSAEPGLQFMPYLVDWAPWFAGDRAAVVGRIRDTAGNQAVEDILRVQARRSRRGSTR